MQGWIKLYRELLEKPIWLLSTPGQRSVLITILILANHAGKKWEWNGEPFEVQPGQFITSLPSLATKSGKGTTIQMVRGALQRFTKLQFITDQTTGSGRLITIVNWGKYQGEEFSTTDQATGGQQSNNRPTTPNKNVKNVKKKTLSSSTVPVAEIIEYLNQKTGKHFTTKAAATKTKINARWKEGYGLDEFKKVIDVKSAEWNGTDAAKWLRPETLFGTKFEAYLNEQPTAKPTSSPTREDLTERTERIRSFVLNRHIDGMDNASIKQMLAEGGADVSLDTIQKIISKGDANGS